jgi:hypothetical protein
MQNVESKYFACHCERVFERSNPMNSKCEIALCLEETKLKMTIYMNQKLIKYYEIASPDFAEIAMTKENK